MRQIFSVAGLCISLGACANYSPGTTATAFDGVYAGTVTSSHSGANSCGGAGSKPGSLTVEKGSVVWNSTPSTDVMYAPVMQSGAFQTNDNITMFAGKITNKALIARVTTGTCHIVYDLTRTT